MLNLEPYDRGLIQGNFLIAFSVHANRWLLKKRMLRLVAGVNTARHQAYQKMLDRGFTVDMVGIIMQRPNEASYNRPDVYLIDDWR